MEKYQVPSECNWVNEYSLLFDVNAYHESIGNVLTQTYKSLSQTSGLHTHPKYKKKMYGLNSQ